MLQIAQELTFLHSNLIKEQSTLNNIIKSKDSIIESLDNELKELRMQNKTLMITNKTKLLMEDRDMDTPSSEENSPKSSFSNKDNKLRVNVDKSEMPPQLLPKGATGDQLVKPPVPSRAGVNKKLNKSASEPSTPTEPPPRPPLRTTSSKPFKEDRFDSGRESDATDAEMNLSTLTTPPHNSPLASPGTHWSSRSDDGFSSSHEDTGRPHPPPRSSSMTTSELQIPTIRQLTNHRAVQKPSDIKYRSKLRSSTIPPSNSYSGGTTSHPGGTLDNDQMTTTGSVGDMTTVTYWSGPYL